MRRLSAADDLEVDSGHVLNVFVTGAEDCAYRIAAHASGCQRSVDARTDIGTVSSNCAIRSSAALRHLLSMAASRAGSVSSASCSLASGDNQSRGLAGLIGVIPD